jgi:hypothetical protein
MDFITQYKAARRVSTPLVAIRTFDAKSTVDRIRGALGENLSENALILWDNCNGMRAITEKGIEEVAHLLDGQPVEASIPAIETLRMATKARHNVTIFVSNAHLAWPNEPQVVQGIWNLRDVFKANGNMLILLCHPGAILPPELTSDVLVMDEPLPTAEEIQAIVSETFKFAKLDAPDLETLAKATDALIGLPAFPAEQSTAMCLDKKSACLNIPELWNHKRQVISQTPGLSVWDGPERLEDIGGIESVKRFCSAIMNGNDAPKTIIFLDEIEKAFAGTGTDMSGVKTELTGSMLSWMQDRDIDGVIFIGLPGVSKSQLAKALGGSFGVPVINFDLAGMQSSLVGSSGANLRAAQKTVDAISGGRVLAIATCNGIDALPPELQGRFQLGTFFFDAPTAEERALIWNIYRKKYGIADMDATPESNGWVGREIRECCKKAYRLKMTLSEAARYVVPVTRSNADKVAALRQSCSGKYLSASRPGVYMMSESAHTSGASTIATVPQSGRVVHFNEE